MSSTGKLSTIKQYTEFHLVILFVVLCEFLKGYMHIWLQ